MQGVERVGKKSKVRLPIILLLIGALIFFFVNKGPEISRKTGNNPFFLENNYRFSIMMDRELLKGEVLNFKVHNILPSEILRVHQCTNKNCSRATIAKKWNGEEVVSGDVLSYSAPKNSEHYIWLEDRDGLKNQKAIGVDDAVVKNGGISVTYLSGSSVVISLGNMDMPQALPFLDSLKVRFTHIILEMVSRVIEIEEDAAEISSDSEITNNLVKNSGFDHNLNYWHSRHDLEPFSHDSRGGHTKSGSLAIRTKPPERPKKHVFYRASISQCIRLNDGLRYSFAASFKPKGVYLSQHTNRVNLSWYQSDDCSVGGQFGTYLEPKPDNDGWQRIARTVTRALNAKSAQVEISQNKVSANKISALWDDIELVTTERQIVHNTPDISRFTLPLGANYIKNSEFSKNLENWRYSGDTVWASDVGAETDGAARLAIFSDRGGYGTHSFSQCINIGSPRVFTFGAKVKVDPVSTFEGGGIFRLIWYEGLNCRGRSQAGFKEDRVEYIDDWQSIGVDEIIAPENALSTSIYLTRGIDDSGSFAYFVDDVFFVAKQ